MHFSDIETAYKNDQYPDAECMLTYPGEVTGNRPFTPAGINLKPVTITENGEYNPADFDADGFSWVDVDVEGQAEPVLEPLVCNYNGTFTPPEGVDGFNSVTTNIHPANPYVGNFTTNQTLHVDGEYNGVDITVDVDAITNELTVTENGTYTPEAGVDGFSEVVVNVPDTYVGNTLKYLCYASFTGEDPATTDINYPLDIKSYGGYDDYLTYNTYTNEIVVKKDFTAVIMLWDVNYNTGSQPAIMGIKLNGNYFISPIRTVSNSVDSVGTINTSFKSLDNQEGIYINTYIPDKSNCILLPLHVNDRLAIQKPFDHGWLHAYMKIYKLFDSTTSTDNFMNSVITTSDTSNYVNVNAGGSLTFDTLTATQNGQYTPTHDGYSTVTVAVPSIPSDCIIVENAKICDSTSPITVTFDRPLTQLEGYIVSIKDANYTEPSINFFQYYRDDSKYFFLNKDATDSASFSYTSQSISANFQSYRDRWISIYKVPSYFYCNPDQN